MSLFLKRTVEAFTKSLANYVPGGKLFVSKNMPQQNLYMLLSGLAEEAIRANGLLIAYNEQYFPDLTIDFIEEWEQALGIPDACFPGAEELNLDTRRLHILIKLASLGVQTVDDFINISELLGFVDTTVEPGIEAGLSAPDGRFTIVVKFKLESDLLFPLSFAIPFGTDQFGILECLFTNLKPANCDIQFGFI